jgi:ABC-type multidrug transport system fused ATPase/permease subunit
MKYHPGLPFSLKGFNLSIISVQKVGIVGRTGAGKSSILQILFRLVNPDSGTVYIDGVDYKSIDLNCLRSQISIIPQTSTLFAVSLRENIDPFNLYSDEQIWKVLKQVGLNDVVSASRMKLEAVVGTDDFGLSDGQAQLLCIARILLKENFIVVMDEATANLDHQTDQFIQKIIKERFKFRTFLVIAHRIRTIVDSDLICVMSDGKCVEYGTHCELLGKSESAYRQFLEDSHYE